jgi:hypothetical protein
MKLGPAHFILAFAVAACSDTAWIQPPPDDEPYDGPVVTASGVVIDSLTGQLLAGVRVASGKQVTYTDASGAWWLDVPQGVVSFSTSPAGYEPMSFRVEVRGHLTLPLLVRRNAPVIRGCYRDGSLVRALLTDLQGRKSVERWAKSRAVIVTPGATITVMAPNWQYFPAPDYFDWPIAIGDVPPEATSILWDVYDTPGGNRFTGSCELGVSPGE